MRHAHQAVPKEISWYVSRIKPFYTRMGQLVFVETSKEIQLQ